MQILLILLLLCLIFVAYYLILREDNISFQEKTILNNPIPCDGDWSDWSPCTKTCGGGEQTRNYNTQVESEGNACPSDQTQVCNDTPCPPCNWSPTSLESSISKNTLNELDVEYTDYSQIDNACIICMDITLEQGKSLSQSEIRIESEWVTNLKDSEYIPNYGITYILINIFNGEATGTFDGYTHHDANYWAIYYSIPITDEVWNLTGRIQLTILYPSNITDESTGSLKIKHVSSNSEFTIPFGLTSSPNININLKNKLHPTFFIDRTNLQIHSINITAHNTQPT